MSNLFAFGEKVIGGGESSQSDGHIIQNPSGTAMPTQPNLQFADANVSNDSTNNATVVRNFVDIDWDDWQEVDDSDDTYYRVKDAPLVDGNVEVDLMKKLWENDSPAASFAAQDITLSSDDYDFTIALFKTHTTESQTISVMTPKGNNIAIYASFTSGSTNNISNGDRICTYSSYTSYSVGNCRIQMQGSARTNNNNEFLVPLTIYGIKQKVSISLSAIISNVSTSASKCMLDENTSIADVLTYSTTEHVVGKWIDGSPIYEKTIDCGALPNATVKSVAHNISNLDKIVQIQGIAIGSSQFLPLPWVSNTNSDSYNIRVNGTPTSVDIYANINYTSFVGYVTLRYTKTS